MEKKDEKTIAIQTDLNINLLGSLFVNLRNNPEKKLGDFFYEWQKSIGWDQKENYNIVNQGVMLTHLYGLIVYPKNIFHNDIPTIKLKDIDKKSWGNYEFKSLPTKEVKILGEKKFIHDESEMTLEFFIRKIRNSLSHASIEILENMDFIFSDEDGSKIYFTISGLQIFTQKFMRCYLSQMWE